MDGLQRIASDLVSQEITFGDLWNNEGKRSYLNRLKRKGVLPTEAERLQEPIRLSLLDSTTHGAKH